MTVSEAAYQRKNRVLADPGRRLSSLTKSEFEDDGEPSEPPASFLKEMMTMTAERKPRPVAKPVEAKVSPLDLKGTQRIAFCNLCSYVVSMLMGGFTCHALHGYKVDRYCPFFLRMVFSMLDVFGLGHVIRALVSAWYRTPEPMQHTAVKVLMYGSVVLNLYPIFASVRKQADAPKPTEPETEEVCDSAGEGDSAPAEEPSSGGLLLDLDEENLVKIASFMIRSSAACLVFGLLGYDSLYNAHMLFRFFA